MPFAQPFQQLLDRVEVGLAAGVPFDGYVEDITLTIVAPVVTRLAQRHWAAPTRFGEKGLSLVVHVHRQEEDGCITLKYLLRTVTMVDIEIEDRNP